MVEKVKFLFIYLCTYRMRMAVLNQFKKSMLDEATSLKLLILVFILNFKQTFSIVNG